MGKIGKVHIIVLTIVVVSLATGAGMFFSRETGVLMIEGATEVLAKPFPLDHPYQNTKGPNEVIKVLQAGEQIPYSNKNFDKDFATYEVKVEGRKGYVVFGGAFKERQE